jgi:biotin carboxylase
VPRILLLIPTRTYRTRAFMRAAQRLKAEVVVGSERPQVLARSRPGTTAVIDFRHPERAAEQAAALVQERPFDAVVGVDDATSIAAVTVAKALGLPHNDVAAVKATRNKALMRRMLVGADVLTPWFEVVSLDDDLVAISERVPYPCVVKPIFLSASRGVIRANDAAEFQAAIECVRAILVEPDVAAEGGVDARQILVEGFIPGVEVALEGILIGGNLKVLALFDKPDPLNGPYFEETIYVTPSRLPDDQQRQVVAATARGACALGLREGPVHAELRVNHDGAWIVEIAARSIGGLCSNTLEFSDGATLEELILLHAVGADVSHFEREPEPSGVMMLPTPRAGILRGVRGVEAARAVPGIVDVTISIPVGERLVPLPEGNRYLGFVFARGESVDQVEAALREAQRRLQFDIS